MNRSSFIPALAAAALLLPSHLLAQPYNDDCTFAIPVNEGNFEYYIFDDATHSVTASCDSPAAGNVPDVWYSYTPAASGTATFTTCGQHPYEPVPPSTITIFASCEGPEIVCSSGGCADGQTTATVPVVFGQTYLIRLAPVDGLPTEGILAIRLRADCTDPAPGAPANDCCAGATPVTEGSWAFTTVGATRDYWSDLDQAIDNNPDVWFDYTATATGFSKVRPETDAPADLSVSIFADSCSGEQIACDCNYLYSGQTRQVSFPTVAGSHYLIRVRSVAYDPDAPSTASGHLLIAQAFPPVNDDCASATNITGLGTFEYDNTIANNSGPDDQLICDSFLGGEGLWQDVWFRWTSNLPAGQDAVVSTVNSPQGDTKIAVYTDHCAPGIALDCNDRVNPEFGQSEVVFTPTPGAAYLIRVGSIPNIGNMAPPQGRPGSFTISMQPTCVVTAPPGAIIEPENCGEDTNGGCFGSGLYTDIPCGSSTIFGTAPVLDGGVDADGFPVSLADEDYYRAVLPVAAHVTFGGTAEFPFSLAIFDGDCNFVDSPRYPYGPCNDAVADRLEDDLPAGTYIFAIRNARTYSPCDRANNYVLYIDIGACEPSGQCCVGASCSVMPHSVCVNSGGMYGGDDTACPPASGVYDTTTCSDAFEDISAFGAPGPACDDCGQAVDLGFTFTFYQRAFTSVHVSSNGFLAFGDDMDPAAFPPHFGLPDPGAKSVVAPWWANLDPTSGGSISTATLGTAPNRRFVAEWSGVQNAYLAGAGVTFEAILYEGTNQIAFRYGDVNLDVPPVIATISPDGSVFTELDPNNLNSCTTLTPTLSTNPCCRADFNYDGHVAVQDIFDFLNAWFAGDPRADFDGGGLAVSDIFAFLNAWFAGC
jgi:hypothetical protein